MKISKHLHSCILIEHKNQTILIDPGIYTYEEKALDINKLEKLDYILITHEHADHMHIPFIKELLQKFPNVTIISNKSVVNLLKSENINAQTKIINDISIENTPHEKLWEGTPPKNVAFTVWNKLTHPGDSLHFTKTADILALPVQAPWGSMVSAIEKAIGIKPKVIIPIHDYHWKDKVRIGLYKRMQEYFQKNGINFKPVETGEVIEV